MSVSTSALAVYLICLCGADAPPAVSINGQKLSSAEWEFLRLTRGGKEVLTPQLRERLIDQAIERQLIRGFLAKRKIAAPAELVNLQLQQLEDTIRQSGEDPQKAFAKLGLTNAQLRHELGLTLAWQVYVQQTAAESTLQKYFAEHRSELDGTRVLVRQIFRKSPADAPDADRQAAEKLLTRLKTEIEAKQTTFEDAARQHSQAPTADRGGEVGWVSAPGRLPEEVTVAVLKMMPGQLAGPIRTAFGLHLIQVTERQAGQLSVEDARPVILERLAGQWWKETVERERAAAKIVRP